MGLIMPKQDATIETLEISLDIYNESAPNFVSNRDFKNEFRTRAGLPANTDEAMLVKKSEIGRYFGLIDNTHFVGNQAKITERGIRYKNTNINEDRIELIFESLETDSFGKNNCAIKSSDSLIDPPKLLLKSIYELTKINVAEFAYLLYATSDLGLSLSSSVINILLYRNNEFLLPTEIPRKYRDSKFAVFFKSIGILIDERGYYKIPPFIYNIYADRISSMSIYNEVIDDNVETDSINTNLPLPILNETLLESLNNRIPEVEESTRVMRYKTNSRLKKTVIEQSSYLCNFNNDHITFDNKENKPFMEGHHLIPMSAQSDFGEINLDRIENIISLCPNCHRAIHYGNDETRFNILEELYNEKRESLLACGITITLAGLKEYYV